MKAEIRIFGVMVPFFLVVGLGYGLWSVWEPVGTLALLLVAGLAGMVSFYLLLVSRRVDPRPEDDPYAEVEAGAGDLGVFSPWSWWPLVVAAGAAVGFLAMAIGWWLMVIGAMVAVIGLVGWIFEFSRGQHAH